MMVRRVRFALLSFIAVLGQVVLSGTAKATQAEAATIMHETFKGDAVITRNVTAPKPGAYLLILRNGTVGPHNIEQCDVEDSDEEKSECLSKNLSENVDQDFSRAKEAEIKINGRWVQGITNARSLLIVPVTLKGGSNKIDIQLQGRSSSKLTVSLEPAPQTPLPPEAAFLVNRLTNPVRTPFTFDAKESFSPNGNSLRYSWNFGDGAIESGKSRVSHSFSKPGTYSVQLTVTDQATRLSSSFSVDVTVLGNDKTKPPKNEKPKPIIQYALDTTNPLHVTFDGTQSTDDGTIVSYRWQIADENHEHRRGSAVERTGAQFEYIFPRAGSYTVRLTVKDNQGAEAATERVVSTSDMSGLVRDESLFGPKKYYSKKKVVESFTLESPRLAVLKIKNADGLEHPIESCARTPWPEKLSCLFQNSVNRAYVALYRVSQAEVFINGQRVTDRIGKHTAYFETVVSLQTSNTIEIRTKGWPTAFIELELQSLEVNEAPIVYVTHSEPRRGIPQTIEFDASTSVDMNDRIMSYRFQAFKADGRIAIDTDWQAASYAALEFTERGTFTVVVSARDTFGAVGTKSLPITIESNQLPLVTASYVILSNQAPYQVRVTAIASDPDGDAIQYNFAYSTGQVSGFQDSPQGLTSFAAAGTFSVDVTARDINGGTATFTLPITVGGNLLPIANFDFVTDRGGYAPLTITVDASPSSDPDDAKETLRYFWTFGDNSPRVEGKVLSHTFQTQGHYVVTLSVLDPKRGLSTKSRAAFAWRTTPPNPVLIANPRVGPASLTVDFDASQSTPGASPIASYLFDYADGTFDRSLTPYISHTFTQPGIYNVALIVYDTDGNGNIGGQTIYVFDGKKPSAAIQVVSSDVITPARFELQGSGVSPNPLGTITDYKWTLPNGTVQTGASLVYTTSTNGNFNIQLQVKDSYGYWSDPASIDLSAASGTLPIAQITADKTRIALGQAVKLSGLNSYTSNGQANLVSYEWTLPNGNKIYGPEKTVTFSATGLKTVSLVVTDSKGYVSSPATIQIQVDARQTPTAVITASTSGTVIPVTATANGLQSTTPNPGATITGYEWRLQAPDATPPLDIQAFGAEMTGTLIWPVNYTLSLRVFDSAGAVSGWVSHTFGPLLNTPPLAVITPSSVIDTAPTTVTLSSIGSTDPDGHNIINAHWIFSDGGEYWGLIAPYYIANPGNYTATVRVLDEYGAWSDPVTIPIKLNANLPPVALMTAAPDTNNKFNFTFDASTSFDVDGTIARYDWFFSDGFVSLGAGSAISHAFPAAGTWRAGVNVFDNKGAMATVQVEVTVSANLPPVARIKVLSTDFDTRSMSLSATESTDDTGIASYAWSFDDGTTASGAAATKSFDLDGSHQVTLTVTDVDGQSNTTTNYVVIEYQGPPIAHATASIERGFSKHSVYSGETLTADELPATINFSSDNSFLKNAYESEYLWTFGDGTTSTEQNPIHRFNKTGLYNVTLRVRNATGSTASASLNVSVPEELCMTDEHSTCFDIVDQNPAFLSARQSLTLAPKTPMTFVADTVSLFLSKSGNEYSSDEPSIDVSSYATVNGGQIVVDIPALLPTLTAPLATYDLNISAIEETNGSPIHGTIRGISVAGGSISIALNDEASEVIIRNENGVERTQSPHNANIIFSDLPMGNYSINISGPTGMAYGNASVESLAPISLTGSLQTTLQNAISNALTENNNTGASIAGKSSSLSKLITSNSKTTIASAESQASLDSSTIFSVASMSPSEIPPYLGISEGTASVTFNRVSDPLNSIVHARTMMSMIVDPSTPALATRSGFSPQPGQTVNLSCYGYSENWALPLYSDMDALFQQAEALYATYVTLLNTLKEKQNTWGLKRQAANQAYAYCQTLPHGNGDPAEDLSYNNCNNSTVPLYLAAQNYFDFNVVPAQNAADQAANEYQLKWTYSTGPTRVYGWRAAQASQDVTYRLIAHLRRPGVATAFRSIALGTFSTSDLRGSWVPAAGNWSSFYTSIVGENAARFTFTMPKEAPAGTTVTYELKHNGPGPQRYRTSPSDSSFLRIIYPRHHAVCSPSPEGSNITVTKLGVLTTSLFAQSSTSPATAPSAMITSCVAQQAGSAGGIDCTKVRSQLADNSTRLFSLAYADNAGLLPIDTDDSLEYPEHINPFPKYNPIAQANESAHQQFVRDNYDILFGVEAQLNGISKVDSIDIHITRGTTDFIFASYPINLTVREIVDRLRQKGVAAQASQPLGIATIHISHQDLIQKIKTRGWDQPIGTDYDRPVFEIRLVVNGTAPFGQTVGTKSIPIHVLRDLKQVTSGSIRMNDLLYGKKISAFGTNGLHLLVERIATTLNSAQNPFAQIGPFKMNDGALPYGGEFPSHGAHRRAKNLDIKYFGGFKIREDYDDIVSQTTIDVDGTEVPLNTNRRYADILTLLTYSKNQKTPGEYTLMDTEQSCLLKFPPDFNLNTRCSNRLTVEKCLYGIEPTAPEPGHTLSACSGSPPLAAANRLASWVLANRAGIIELRKNAKALTLFTSAGTAWYHSFKQRLASRPAWMPAGTPWNGQALLSGPDITETLIENARLPNFMTLKIKLEVLSNNWIDIGETKFDNITFDPSNEQHYNHIHINGVAQ